MAGSTGAGEPSLQKASLDDTPPPTSHIDTIEEAFPLQHEPEEEDQQHPRTQSPLEPEAYTGSEASSSTLVVSWTQAFPARPAPGVPRAVQRSLCWTCTE